MKTIAEVKKDILQILASKKMVIGTKETLGLLKAGRLDRVLLASNTPAATRKTIYHYSSLAGVKCEELPMQNDELGNACKKPFAISVLSVKKE